jgi:hypothetical protein
VVVRLGVWSLTAMLAERGFRLVIDDEALARGLIAHDVAANTRTLREMIPLLRQAVPQFAPREDMDMMRGRLYVLDLEEVTALLAAVGGPKVVPCIYGLREAFKAGQERVREVRRQWREEGEAEAAPVQPTLPHVPVAPAPQPAPATPAGQAEPPPAATSGTAQAQAQAEVTPAPAPVVRTVREPPGGFRTAAPAPAPVRKAHKARKVHKPLPDLQLTPEELESRKHLPSIKGIKDSEAFKVREAERIRKALELMGWHRMKAALLLEMPRRTFYRKAIGYGIIVVEKATTASPKAPAGKARKAG